MTLQTITIKEYLTKKGIIFKETGNELITKCLFNNCDDDSRVNEAHLYFSADTGQYDCKKCSAQGNIFTLREHFGDEMEDIAITQSKPVKNSKKQVFSCDLVEECHLALPERIKQYLNGRGITDSTISEKKIGWGQFYGKQWITIPISDENEEFKFFKLRKNPEDDSNPDKYKFYPTGSSASLYGWSNLKNNNDMLMICEGELDCSVLNTQGILAITSTAGALTFKEEWIPHLANLKKVYICFDKDEAGKNGMKKLIKQIQEKLPYIQIYRTELPDRMRDGKDITDYFCRYGGTVDELMDQLSKPVPNENVIDTTKFQPLTLQALSKVLSLTIKQDEENKIVTFLGELSAYTENSQFNISYNAPSSTGKSYIPTEIAGLFPQKDVIEIGYCSPTAFFHDVGAYDKEKNCYMVDLSRKILIFLDQPHTQLLERLRPLLSHDKKEITIKITDKTQKFGMKTKTVILRGYPMVIFCTAGLQFDEQEATRFLLLSPEINQGKIRQGIQAKIRKETDNDSYKTWLEADPDRKLLKQRIWAIKQANIAEIKICSEEQVSDRFLQDNKMLKPRHQRDIGRLLSLIKVIALLNLWWREKNESTITANEEDIEMAFQIWNRISVSQELNLPPYIYNLYQEVILPAWSEKNDNRNEAIENVTGKLGLTRQEILQKHYLVYGRMLDNSQLRQQILPMLETAGLIMQEPDPSDKRKILIYPTVSSTISEDQNK